MNATQPSPQPLAPHHAERAAELHILGQPGTFLTSLGPGVLRVLYQSLPTSPVGFGRAVVDEEGRLLAFIAMTTSTGRLFVEMGTRRLHRLLPPLLARLLRQPSLLPRSMQTLLYPLLAGDGEETPGPSAELLAIMTDPDRRGQGLGSQLLAAALDDCRQRGIHHVHVTVDATNQGARRFYERRGFRLQKEIHLYGREMVVMGIGDWGLGIGDRGAGIGDWGLGTGDRGLGTGDQGSGIGDRGSEARSRSSSLGPLGRIETCEADTGDRGAEARSRSSSPGPLGRIETCEADTGDRGSGIGDRGTEAQPAITQSPNHPITQSPPIPNPQSPIPNLQSLIPLLLLGLLTVAGLLWWGGGAETLRVMGQAHWGLIGLAGAIHYGGFGLRGLRWQRLLGIMGYRLPWGYVTTLLLAGWFVSALVPARAGDLARVGVLRAGQGARPPVPAADGLGSIVLERALDIIAILTLGAGFGFWALRGNLPGWVLTLYAVGVAMIGALGVGLLVAPSLLTWLAAAWGNPLWQKALGFGGNVIASLRRLLRQPAQALLLLGQSLLIWLCDALLLWLVLLALGQSLDLGNAGFVALTVDVVATVPLTPGGMGQIDLAYSALLALLALPTAIVPAAVLLTRAISYWSFLGVSGLAALLIARMMKNEE